METIQTILFGVMLFGFAGAVISWLVAAIAVMRAFFQRQPGVNIFGNSDGIFLALLKYPELFTEAGQKSRRICIRGLQGFLASAVVILSAGPFSGREVHSDGPWILWPVFAAVAVLLLFLLQRLSHR